MTDPAFVPLKAASTQQAVGSEDLQDRIPSNATSNGNMAENSERRWVFYRRNYFEMNPFRTTYSPPQYDQTHEPSYTVPLYYAPTYSEPPSSGFSYSTRLRTRSSYAPCNLETLPLDALFNVASSLDQDSCVPPRSRPSDSVPQRSKSTYYDYCWICHSYLCAFKRGKGFTFENSYWDFYNLTVSRWLGEYFVFPKYSSADSPSWQDSNSTQFNVFLSLYVQLRLEALMVLRSMPPAECGGNDRTTSTIF